MESFRELMEFVLATTERSRLLVPVPFALARLQASILQFLPNPPLTPDQVELLRHDNVVSTRAIHAETTRWRASASCPRRMRPSRRIISGASAKTGQFRKRPLRLTSALRTLTHFSPPLWGRGRRAKHVRVRVEDYR